MGEGSKDPYVFHVLTLFPEMVLDAVRHSVLGRSIESGIVEVRAWDIRGHAKDRHRTVDDVPYGGGPGMVMKVEPLADCLATVRDAAPPGVLSVLLSAAGPRFDQTVAGQLAEARGIILVCGHYEGVDERVAEHYVDQELSVGDYVLSGGEIPALVVIDSVARLLPGVLGNHESLQQESHLSGVLEYPQYTRPADFHGLKVPDVLLSGNHADIESFRQTKALEKTRANRPDLFSRLETKADAPRTPKARLPRLGRPAEDE